MIFFPNIESGYETACFYSFYRICGNSALQRSKSEWNARCQRRCRTREVHRPQNRESGNNQGFEGKDHRHDTRNKGTQILLQFKRLVGRYRNKMGTGKQTAEKSSYGKSWIEWPEVIGSGSAISIPKGCSDSGRHIPQRYGPDRKGAETKRGGNWCAPQSLDWLIIQIAWVRYCTGLMLFKAVFIRLLL